MGSILKNVVWFFQSPDPPPPPPPPPPPLPAPIIVMFNSLVANENVQLALGAIGLLLLIFGVVAIVYKFVQGTWSLGMDMVKHFVYYFIIFPLIGRFVQVYLSEIFTLLKPNPHDLLNPDGIVVSTLWSYAKDQIWNRILNVTAT